MLQQVFSELGEKMMEETTKPQTCDVCGLNPGEVLASGLGPVSYPCCKICLEQGAESIGVVCLTIFLQGGPASGEKYGPAEVSPDRLATFI